MACVCATRAVTRRLFTKHPAGASQGGKVCLAHRPCRSHASRCAESPPSLVPSLAPVPFLPRRTGPGAERPAPHPPAFLHVPGSSSSISSPAPPTVTSLSPVTPRRKQETPCSPHMGSRHCTLLKPAQTLPTCHPCFIDYRHAPTSVPPAPFLFHTERPVLLLLTLATHREVQQCPLPPLTHALLSATESLPFPEPRSTPGGHSSRAASLALRGPHSWPVAGRGPCLGREASRGKSQSKEGGSWLTCFPKPSHPRASADDCAPWTQPPPPRRRPLCASGRRWVCVLRGTRRERGGGRRRSPPRACGEGATVAGAFSRASVWEQPVPHPGRTAASRSRLRPAPRATHRGLFPGGERPLLSSGVGIYL